MPSIQNVRKKGKTPLTRECSCFLKPALSEQSLLVLFMVMKNVKLPGQHWLKTQLFHSKWGMKLIIKKHDVWSTCCHFIFPEESFWMPELTARHGGRLEMQKLVVLLEQKHTCEASIYNTVYLGVKRVKCLYDQLTHYLVYRRGLQNAGNSPHIWALTLAEWSLKPASSHAAGEIVIWCKKTPIKSLWQ